MRTTNYYSNTILLLV